MVGARLATLTTMLKAGSDALSLPSLAVMTIPMYSPAAVVPGVPDNRPVVASNVAQVGLLPMLNVSLSLSASEAVGVKAYDCPATTDVAGEPEIVGARFGTLTAMLKAGSDVLSLPSLTEMTMPL